MVSNHVRTAGFGDEPQGPVVRWHIGTGRTPGPRLSRAPYLHLAGCPLLLGPRQLHGGCHLLLPGGALLGEVLRGLLAGHSALVARGWAGPWHHVQHGDDGAWLQLWLLPGCLGGHDVEGRRRQGALLGGRRARGQPRGPRWRWRHLLGGDLGRWGWWPLGQKRVVGVQGAVALLLPVTLGLDRPQLAPPVLCGERGETSQGEATHPPVSALPRQELAGGGRKLPGLPQERTGVGQARALGRPTPAPRVCRCSERLLELR